MSEKVLAVAKRFVDLVRKYGRLNQVGDLPPDEVQVLFDIVMAAGFNPKEVKPGKLTGDYLDQGGRTGETYLINSACPFVVVDQEGDDHHFATGWLDCAVRTVLIVAPAFTISVSEQDRYDQLVNEIAEEIERSIPMSSILLNLEGDQLCEHPRGPLFGCLGYFVDHPRDHTVLIYGIGRHMYCGGEIRRRRATESRDSLACKECGLRVLFPKDVKTFGELREALVPRSVPV
ncbi:MAG: hypothetical protein AAB738_04110 [Patescibacteria group bacterium]